jgi:hypothetical protein
MMRPCGPPLSRTWSDPDSEPRAQRTAERDVMSPTTTPCVIVGACCLSSGGAPATGPGAADAATRTTNATIVAGPRIGAMYAPSGAVRKGGAGYWVVRRL